VALRLLLADDHEVVREGLKVLLERQGFDVVAEAGDGREAVHRARDVAPDVAVLDLSMPELNGLDAAQEITRLSPRTRCILLTMHSEYPHVIEALRGGLRGYVVKTHAATDLVHAIHEVCRGRIYLSASISQAVIETYLAKAEPAPDPLTPREREVLQLVADGKTTKEIAELLRVSVKTAEGHRIRIMKRLDIHATAGLVRYAIRQGLVQP
jgi:two-component system response regulator NreC